LFKSFREQSLSYKIFDICNAFFMLLILMVTLYPFVNTLAVSLNDGMDTIRGGIYFWPRVFTWGNYTSIFSDGKIYHAFFVSVGRTVLGTLLSVFCTAMLAYTLSRKEYVFRKQITFIYILTMYFSGGLIPSYFLMRSLNLINNFWVYIIPGLVGAFNLIVIRTYIQGLPESLVESAKIDGCGDFRIFMSIILPLCTPVLATIALFIAVGQWNAWFDTFIYCSKQSLSTMQYELMKLLASATQLNVDPQKMIGNKDNYKNSITPASVRAAITIATTIPIVIVYPFLQRYFITGLTIGGVKE